MASKSGPAGIFLSSEERESLIKDIVKYERREQRYERKQRKAAKAKAALSTSSQLAGGTTPNPRHHSDDEDGGCRVCHVDDDHTNMLLCEKCNGEYHFYCIGLRSIPTDDWYCADCQPNLIRDAQLSSSPSAALDLQLLNLRVASLPPAFTSRFGQIVWAQGGSGFGWWPSFIYDPRLSVGGARELAQKHFGKRHLVYFFQCLEAPFAVLADSKLVEWYHGLTENYHLGKAARHHSRLRAQQFEEAMQIATFELLKPLEERLDWNHFELFSTTSGGDGGNSNTPNQGDNSTNDANGKRGREDENNEDEDDSDIGNIKKKRVTVRSNLNAVLAAFNGKSTKPRSNKKQRKDSSKKKENENTAQSEEEEDMLYLRVMRAPANPPSIDEEEDNDDDDEDDDGKNGKNENKNKQQKNHLNVGFIQVPNKKTATFADARKVMQDDLDDDILPKGWKFFIPVLGPMSKKQESKLGPMFSFLQKADPSIRGGGKKQGTITSPIQIQIKSFME